MRDERVLTTTGTKSVRLKKTETQQTSTADQLPVHSVATPGYMLGLQRHYGNQFVQHIVNLSRQGKGKSNVVLRMKQDLWQIQQVVQRNQVPLIKSAGQNIAHIHRTVSDPILEVANQFYGHGAFMGAAIELLADRKWKHILEILMPDVYTDATQALTSGTDSGKIILMFENNPVMAAYGMYQTQQLDTRREGRISNRISKMQAIEWDAFLPTDVVEKFNYSDNSKEKSQLAVQLVDKMLIAHGTTFQTLRENAPLGGLRQYKNVISTPKSSQGGVQPSTWMELFGRAIQLALDPSFEKKGGQDGNLESNSLVDSPNDQAYYQMLQKKLDFADVIANYKKIFNKETFSVLLDIKSRDATPQVIGALVQELNNRGVHVYGVGTFQHHEITGLSETRQVIDEKNYTGPKEIKFFHLAGDLQQGCINNRISKGDTVMFNVGSLINYDRYARSLQKKASYRIKTEVVNQLREYKLCYGFHLGVYVQENDIDDRAATLVTELTNRNQDIFDLGFAWGGLSGRVTSDIEPSLTDATVGTIGQYIVGTHWNTKR